MHLSEETVNEYLDGALPLYAREETNRHLETCPACQARLESLRSLFAELEVLPDAILARDLSPAVVMALENRVRVPRVVRLVALGQALVALVIFALAWPLLNISALAPATRLYLPSSTELGGWFVLQWAAWMQSLAALSALPAFNTSFSLNLDPPATLLTLTIVSACLLWLVGNGLLLRSRAGSYKRRNS